MRDPARCSPLRGPGWQQSGSGGRGRCGEDLPPPLDPDPLLRRVPATCGVADLAPQTPVAACVELLVEASGTALRLAVLATLFLVVIAGAVQAEVDSKDFETFWDGVWWAVVTVTTVGYGDSFPTTVAGRIVGIVLMLVGIGFVAVLTATIASKFVKADRQDESGEILELLRRMEADVAELKTGLPST